MATVPTLQVLYRRASDILFGWKPLPPAEAAYFNLYASDTEGGTYRLIRSKIANQTDKKYRTKVVATIKDAEIGLSTTPPPVVDYWFKLTFVDRIGSESALGDSTPKKVLPAGIEPSFENEQEDKNNHNFAWNDSRKRWEKVLVDDDGKLVVDAQVDIGSITLGNVKVAARSDNTTVEYLLVRDDRVLYVKPLDEFTTITAYDFDTIAASSETTILSHNEGSLFYLTKVICTGEADAIYRLKIGSTIISVERSSWNNRNVKFEFGVKGIEIGGGSTVNVTAEHEESSNQKYEISLMGYKYTA